MKKITIALAGNPNSGKSTLFNAITGARQHIANYPGVTVEKRSGAVIHRDHSIEVVDLPGTYSLTAYSLEEIVARDFLVQERPDLVVDVVDASNLDRNLYLAVQLMELGVPLIVAMNMTDHAESKGLIIDCESLSSLLQVPVIPMVARANKGIQELLDKVVEMSEGHLSWRHTPISYGLDIDQSLKEMEKIISDSRAYDRKYPVRWQALKYLEGDTQMKEILKTDPDPNEKLVAISHKIRKHIMDTLEEEPEGIIADHRYGYITAITKKVVRREIESRLDLSDRIDKVLTHRILGPLFMIAILYGIYAFIFWASATPLHWLELFFDFLKGSLSSYLPEGVLRSLIVSGIVDGVGGVLGFVPLIMFMFFAIAILEDSGYMARISYMLDRVLRWFGLHGNSVIALIVSGGISGGCAVPGVLATRTLRDPKERIATLLVVPFMNCGAKLPIFALFIGAFFNQYQAQLLFILTLLSWAFALLAAKILRATVLRGPKTPFVMELPPYRAPTLQGLLIHTGERTWQYIKKAGTIILGLSILLWAGMTFPGLSTEEKDAFQMERQALVHSLLESAETRQWIKDTQDLEQVDRFYEGKLHGQGEGGLRLLLAQTAHRLSRGVALSPEADERLQSAARRYLDFRKERRETDLKEKQAHLKATVAGTMGHALEGITWPLGFDYRVNIALVSGFAAKETILSTLGTATH